MLCVSYTSLKILRKIIFSLLNMHLAQHHLLRDQPFPMECPGAFTTRQRCSWTVQLLDSMFSSIASLCLSLYPATLSSVAQLYDVSVPGSQPSHWFFSKIPWLTLVLAYPYIHQNPFVHLREKLCWNMIRITVNL